MGKITNAIDLTVNNNTDGFDVSGGSTTVRKLTISGSDVTLYGSGSTTVTFPTTSTMLVGSDVTSSMTVASASWAVSASWALGGGLSGGTTNYVPVWSSTTTFGTASISQVGSNLYVSASLNTNAGITGSLRGTSSWAVSASWAPGGIPIDTSSFVTVSQTASMTVATASYYNTTALVSNNVTSSFAITGSNIFKGNQTISGSLIVSMSVLCPIISMSAIDINWALGNTFERKLTSNTTFTFSNTSSGQYVNVILTNSASAYTCSFSGVTKWKGGTAPTMTTASAGTSKTDIYTFIKHGTVVYGAASQNY